MSDKAFATVVSIFAATIVIVFLSGLVILGLSEDVHKEYRKGNCVTMIHENNHVFDKDVDTVETFCKE